MGASFCGSGVSRERDPTEELAPMGRSYTLPYPLNPSSNESSPADDERGRCQ